MICTSSPKLLKSRYQVYSFLSAYNYSQMMCIIKFYVELLHEKFRACAITFFQFNNFNKLKQNLVGLFFQMRCVIIFLSFYAHHGKYTSFYHNLFLTVEILIFYLYSSNKLMDNETTINL